jgi:hypothetical protein
MKTNNQNSQLISSLFRDFKISVIEGRKFEVSDENYKKFIKSDEYEAYKRYCPGEVISGSRALSLFGLLDRSVRDFDIIIPPHYPKNKFGVLTNIMYSIDEEFENYIGTYLLSYKKGFFSKSYKIQFDFFSLEEDTEIINVGELRLQCPIQIISKKIRILDNFSFTPLNKHFKDLIQILNI